MGGISREITVNSTNCKDEKGIEKSSVMPVFFPFFGLLRAGGDQRNCSFVPEMKIVKSFYS